MISGRGSQAIEARGINASQMLSLIDHSDQLIGFQLPQIRNLRSYWMQEPRLNMLEIPFTHIMCKIGGGGAIKRTNLNKTNLKQKSKYGVSNSAQFTNPGPNIGTLTIIETTIRAQAAALRCSFGTACTSTSAAGLKGSNTTHLFLTSD